MGGPGLCFRASRAASSAARAVALLAALLAAAPLAAQEPTPSPAGPLRLLVPGSRVWVTLRNPGAEMVGTTERLEGDSLILRLHPTASPIRVPIASAGALRTSAGFPSRWESALETGAKGALIGALQSAVVYWFGWATGVERRWQWSTTTLVGGMVGFAGGAFRGATCVPEQWIAVPLPAPARDTVPDPLDALPPAVRTGVGAAAWFTGPERPPRACDAYAEQARSAR